MREWLDSWLSFNHLASDNVPGGGGTVIMACHVWLENPEKADVAIGV